MSIKTIIKRIISCIFFHRIVKNSRYRESNLRNQRGVAKNPTYPADVLRIAVTQ